MNKITLKELGLYLHGLYMSDYFESEDLEEAIEQMIEDENGDNVLIID